MSENKQVGGIVLYPLVYNVNRDDPEASTVICKGIDRKHYVFTLNPPESALEKAKNDKASSYPRIVKFAEIHSKAVNPCRASLTNGREDPHGIFIGEQIVSKGVVSVEIDGQTVQAQAIEGAWASVIRDGKDGYRAPIGYGYLEVGFHPKLSEQGNDYLLRYNEVTEILNNKDDYPDEDLIELTSEKNRLASLIRGEKKKWFVGVLVHSREMITLHGAEQKNIRDVVKQQLLKYTNKGVYGGVIVRAHKNSVVQTALCRTCEHQYDYKKKAVDDIEKIMDDFMKFFGNKLIREAGAKGLIVDVIPVERFNCGGPGIDRYSKDVNSGSSKIMKTYIDKAMQEDPTINIKQNNGFLYSKVAMRLAQTVDGTENYLLSAIHSFSRPIGSILIIDRNGEPSLKLDRQKTTSNEPAMG